jgi:chorismate mutase
MTSLSFSQEFPRLRAVRGATLVQANTSAAIEEAVADLLKQLAQVNTLQEEALVSVFFTLTPDITAVSPAKIARQSMGWHQVPLFCAVEPSIEGLPCLCIRLLIQFYSKQAQMPQAVYLRGAQVLRPDKHSSSSLTEGQEKQ